MRKLWTFGDSYAESQFLNYGLLNDTQELKDEWTTRTAQRLECDHYPHALAGSALSYTYNEFYNIRKDIQENDIIVISLTDHNRIWFWKNKPELAAQLREIPTEKGGSKELNQALKYYTLYLDENPLLDKVMLYNFLSAVEKITKAKNTKTIIIKNFIALDAILFAYEEEFDSLHFAKGVMQDISNNEYNKDNMTYKDIVAALRRDCRLCHMVKQNHIRLADKIVDYVNYNVPIDLKQGFVENIFDKNSIDNPQFVKDELFGRIWNI